MSLNIPVRQMQMPQGGKPPVRLMGFDFGKHLFHVLAFDFGDDGGAIGIWREGDEFCARISLDSLAEFWQAANNAAVMANVPCGRPAKHLCSGGPECWCKLPQMVGTLANLPSHVQDCIREYALAAVRMTEKADVARKDAVLRQALEALEMHGKQYPHMVKGYCIDAITAIRNELRTNVAPLPLLTQHAERPDGGCHHWCKACAVEWKDGGVRGGSMRADSRKIPAETDEPQS